MHPKLHATNVHVILAEAGVYPSCRPIFVLFLVPYCKGVVSEQVQSRGATRGGKVVAS